MPLNKIEKSNLYEILFRFTQAVRYIFQTSEKKSHISSISWQSQKVTVLPRITIYILYINAIIYLRNVFFFKMILNILPFKKKRTVELRYCSLDSHCRYSLYLTPLSN